MQTPSVRRLWKLVESGQSSIHSLIVITLSDISDTLITFYCDMK